MSHKTKKIISVVATVVLFLIGGYFYLTAPDDKQDGPAGASGGGNQYESGDEQQIDSSDTTEELVADDYVTYQFRNQQYLDDHFAKHGSEFDYETAEEYLAGANLVINNPNSLYKTEAEDGDHIYYLESSNEFVVVSTDGYIRTYFKPSAGKKYFDRQ